MAVNISPNSLKPYIKRKITRSYAELDEALKDWYEKLPDSSSGKKVLCIAISRKAPRLLEWCAYKYGHKKIIVISENALPFIDVSSFDLCYVIDEAVYHGTTFKKIYNIVSVADKTKIPLANPFVVTDEALMANLPFNDIFKIEDNDVNFFIDTIISRFHQLGKPYDMEFPLFYVELNENAKNVLPSILDSLSEIERQRQKGKVIRPWYSTSSIAREKGVETINYTFVTDYLFDNILDMMARPSFSKLRFHHKDNILCIMVASPYIINENDLVYDSPLFSGKLLSAWNKIISSIVSSTDCPDDNMSVQRKKSLVVMANYLLSFNMFEILKDSIEDALKGHSISNIDIKKQDLCYLLGNSLANEVSEILGNVSSDCIPAPVSSLLPSSPESRYIPYIYEEAYNKRLSADNLADDAILSECISNQFSAMHWTVEIKSRSSSVQNFDRLQFGESYQSLYSRYKNHGFDRDSLFYDLHKCIDSRIDRGSVVPSYNRFSSYNSNYWVRLFRAGENEDVYRDQHFRIVGNMLRIYSDANNGDRISYGRLLLLLAMVCYKGGVNRIFATKTFISFDESVKRYRVFVEYEDGKRTDIIEHCINYGLLKNDDFGYLILGDRAGEGLYDAGMPLEFSDENRISNLSQFIGINGEAWDDDYLYACEMINFLVYDEQALTENTIRWCFKVKEYLSGSLLVDYEELRREFEMLYSRIPDPQLHVKSENEQAETNDIVKTIRDVKGSNVKALLYKVNWFFYAANTWFREQNNGVKDLYYVSGFVNNLLNSVDSSRLRYKNAIANSHGEELRKILLWSLDCNNANDSH